jgi:hypothetical protein
MSTIGKEGGRIRRLAALAARQAAQQRSLVGDGRSPALEQQRMA